MTAMQCDPTVMLMFSCIFSYMFSIHNAESHAPHYKVQVGGLVCRRIDQWQDGASFRVPRPETGPLLPASLGKRIAFDLPYLTSDLGLEDASDATPDQTQWTLGGLSGAQGSALVRAASACLQQQMAGMLCKTGEEVFTTLRHHHPRVGHTATFNNCQAPIWSCSLLLVIRTSQKRYAVTNAYCSHASILAALQLLSVS